ncbi:MAG: arsenate reductase, glutathione/glutaredoxin type [Cyanobacteriota bacterium]|nr:arsenate reductase, glutathione/glutaredoxin type [Cyanobacteriota bacterium]
MKAIIFVCKKNSCRSQMAEGFARQLSAGKIAVASAGLAASRVHPTAIEVMAEVGIDITGQTSNSLSEFQATDYDAVISLCGCGVNLPQEWVVRDIFEDWFLDDPDGQPISTFRRVRDEIQTRVTQVLEKLS